MQVGRQVGRQIGKQIDRSNVYHNNRFTKVDTDQQQKRIFFVSTPKKVFCIGSSYVWLTVTSFGGNFKIAFETFMQWPSAALHYYVPLCFFLLDSCVQKLLFFCNSYSLLYQQYFQTRLFAGNGTAVHTELLRRKSRFTFCVPLSLSFCQCWCARRRRPPLLLLEEEKVSLLKRDIQYTRVIVQ